VICCSIVAGSVNEAIKDMLSIRSKAEIIEIRLDYINDLSSSGLKEIISKKPLPLIMTFRKKEDRGNIEVDEQKRISILRECISLGVDYVDIELGSVNAVTELFEVKNNTKIIVSYHNFEELPKNIDSIYNKIKSSGCDIVKIACMANNITDNLQMLDLIKKAKEEKTNFIGICMGEKGEISRILNLCYGSYLTYGYLYKGKESAPGQLSCEHLRRLYRVDKLKFDGLKIYGLVGNPVCESRGNILHNLVFKEKEMNAVYLNFLVDDLKSFIHEFKDFFVGLSVTMPFKEEILSYVDEIDDGALKIGAANTIVNVGSKLTAYNTDVGGAIQAIEEKIGISGKKIVMIGAGGVARAIGYGVVSKGGKLIIVNRTEERGDELAKILGAEFKRKEKIDWNGVDILINATSVGMMPKINDSVVSMDNLKNMVVFDTVYNPLITRLLNDAERNGCEIVTGIKMFVYQAARQFELWTGKKVDTEFMEEKVLEYVAE
jgi:3-dehydroquinate dehydratase/shikimate dehydrogenase